MTIGTGQHGLMELSEEAADYLKRKKCRVALLPTGEAIQSWNQVKGEHIGLFHVTC